MQKNIALLSAELTKLSTIVHASARNAILNENGKLLGTQKLICKAAEIKGKKTILHQKSADLEDANSTMTDEPMNKSEFALLSRCISDFFILIFPPFRILLGTKRILWQQFADDVRWK